jgi:RNA recognition motif-containing protein
MTMKNLYVGNLSFQTTADDLRDLFGQHGKVSQAQVVADRDTGRSRGFGFVEMAEGGEDAISALNGVDFQGRTLTVNEAKPREERPRSAGHSAGQGGRGGYGRRY